MPQPLHYIPVVTTCVALAFSWVVFQRYLRKGQGTHLLWWSAGILIYGVGTFTEVFVTLFGWNPVVFRVMQSM